MFDQSCRKASVAVSNLNNFEVGLSIGMQINLFLLLGTITTSPSLTAWLGEHCAPYRPWFMSDTAVVLSSNSSTVILDWFLVKAHTARLAAWISRQLMCHSFSQEFHGPPVLTPFKVAPHPVRDASDSIQYDIWSLPFHWTFPISVGQVFCRPF